MASTTTIKTIGTTGTFSTPQLWEDGAPANLTTAERSACGTFAVATFVQGENLTFVGSGATGVMLDTDSTGIGTGTYMTYGITAGNPAAADVITGTSTATCVLSSGTADFVGVIWEGRCQNQEFTGAGTQLTLGGSTTSSTAYKHCTTVAGASFRDHANVQTNALRYNASNGCGMRTTGDVNAPVRANENFNRISNLQLSNTTSNAEGLECTVTNAAFDFLIVEGTRTTSSSTAATYVVTGNATTRNTVIIQRATGAGQIVGVGTASPFFYNSTIVAPDDLATAPTCIFANGGLGTTTVQNCGLFAGDSTKALVSGAGTVNFTTCYSDISGTAGVTQTTYGNEFQDVNDATRDFRLKTGAAQIDTGTTDSVNAPIDIAGTARPSGAAYDVGAWEFVQSVVGTVLTGFGRIFKGYG